MAEHKALQAERVEILARIRAEWLDMSSQLASLLGERIEAIDGRLKAIERTKSWRYRDVD